MINSRSLSSHFGSFRPGVTSRRDKVGVLRKRSQFFVPLPFGKHFFYHLKDLEKTRILKKNFQKKVNSAAEI